MRLCVCVWGGGGLGREGCAWKGVGTVVVWTGVEDPGLHMMVNSLLQPW